MFPYVAATLFLAGHSVAQTQHNLNLTEVANLTSVDDQVSSNAQLSTQDDPPNNGTEWEDVADKGVDGIEEIIKELLEKLFPDDEETTKTLTITIPGDTGKPTATPEPEPTTVIQDPGTTTVTQDPGTTTVTQDPGTTTVTQDPGTTTVIQDPGTTTVTQDPDITTVTQPITLTVTQEPEPTSAPEETTLTITSTRSPVKITTTLTVTQQPGPTTGPQVPGTTLVKSVTGVTETVVLPHQSGCYKVDNGRVTVGVC